MWTSRFSLFGTGNTIKGDSSSDLRKNARAPILELKADKDAYRPGDSIFITIEISNTSDVAHKHSSLLVEALGVEIKGIEKLDSQWFATPKSVPGMKQQRGEHIFMDCTTSIVSNQIISHGATKTYAVRAVLPGTLPPSYKGATIRYIYFFKSKLFCQEILMEKDRLGSNSMKNHFDVEARIPLRIWATHKFGSTLMEDQTDDMLPSTPVLLDVHWKELNGDSDWAKVNYVDNGVNEEYESSRDEMSSVYSYNITKENSCKKFGSCVSLKSFATRSSTKEMPHVDGRSSLPSSLMLPQLCVAEVLHDSGMDISSPLKHSSIVSPNHIQRIMKPCCEEDGAMASSSTNEPSASEGFIRGKSYNIRLDDQVLLRFSPRNSEALYYFGDMIGGTLTFFHEGAIRCLEISVSLETSETVNHQFVHHSRRSSPIVTKVHSDHYEVVADLLHTSFLFSIPMDGPMSFSTNHVSVQWALRFEFFTSPNNVDCTRYEHPLLVEKRDKNEWVLPIKVIAPPQKISSIIAQNEKPFALDSFWAHK